LVGHVGAGAKIYPLPDGGALEEIDPPPGVGPDAVAVKVIGESMMPRYLEGDVLVSESHVSLQEADGEECVVETSDGSAYVKTVHLENDGLVTLESWNAPLMRNIEAVRVAPIVWVKRGCRRRSSSPR
jgi:phage repressor protein C with HTH and peptisase S24 domain